MFDRSDVIVISLGRGGEGSEKYKLPKLCLANWVFYTLIQWKKHYVALDFHHSKEVEGEEEVAKIKQRRSSESRWRWPRIAC